MGDHRISIKIEFSMHGHTNKLDGWWNFTERNVQGVDHRVIEWLQAQYQKAMDNYLNDQYSIVVRNEAENENRERELLAQLKAKYGE